MAIYLVEIPHVSVELTGQKATITVKLPSDYESRWIDDPVTRRKLENLHIDNPNWIRDQIDSILTAGRGVLADAQHPMRSPGAGILPSISFKYPSDSTSAVLHLRGSNRGQVWPVGVNLPHPLCWKEFAGITGSAKELEDPRQTAIMELYEELSLISNDSILFPRDIRSYPDVFTQVRIAIERAKRHYEFNLSVSDDYYEPIELSNLEGDQNTLVEIVAPTGRKTTFNAIVNFDPLTNALEISFTTTLEIHASLTGILSLAGPENDDVNLKPYMEDIIVVTHHDLLHAELGKEVRATHLLSVHGPENYVRTKPNLLFYAPAPTLEPIVSFMKGEYSFQSVLEIAHKKVRDSSPIS